MYHLLPLKAAASSIQASLISHDISFLISNPFNWALVLGHRRRRDASTIFNHHQPLSLEESHCRWRITIGEHRSYLHALSVMWRWTEMRWHEPALEPRRSPPPTTTDTDLHHLLPRTIGRLISCHRKAALWWAEPPSSTVSLMRTIKLSPFSSLLD